MRQPKSPPNALPRHLRLPIRDLIAAGGNVYYLAKFAGIFGLDVQDIGAQQTGVTKAEFQARLLAEGR